MDMHKINGRKLNRFKLGDTVFSSGWSAGTEEMMNFSFVAVEANERDKDNETPARWRFTLSTQEFDRLIKTYQEAKERHEKSRALRASRGY